MKPPAPTAARTKRHNKHIGGIKNEKKSIHFDCAFDCVGLCLFGFSFFKYQSRHSQTIIDLTTEEKLSDFDALCVLLDESYPFWYDMEQMGIDKEQIYHSYRAEIADTVTDIEYFKCVSYFLKEFQGMGHLSVLDGYMYKVYMDAFHESSSVVSDQEKEAIALLRETLENPVSQHTYGMLDASHGGFRSTKGLKEEYKSQSVETSKQSTNIVEHSWDDSTAYMKISSFDLTNYTTDKEFLQTFFGQIRSVPNLILDLRGNGGGSDLYWQKLIVEPNTKENLLSDRYFLFRESDLIENYVSALGLHAGAMDELTEPFAAQYTNYFTHYTKDTEQFEGAENPYKGKIWVLVDEQVYSSAENFVMFCKNTGFATLVGTATNGDGGVADPILVSLPNSGLIVRFSVFYGLNKDGSGNEMNGTKPDIVVSSEDALERCLQLIH